MGARRFGEPEVVGSIPTTQTIRVVGRADMQPPFKRRDPGSTPGRPTNFWAFGRTVMHLPLKETDVGSTPTAPTKDAPVTQLADVSGLNPDCCEFESRRGYSGDRARAARQPHKLRSVSATLTPASRCRCDVTGQHEALVQPSCRFNSCHLLQMQTWCNWQHRSLVRSRYGFKPHRLIQMCWCSSVGRAIAL